MSVEYNLETVRLELDLIRSLEPKLSDYKVPGGYDYEEFDYQHTSWIREIEYLQYEIADLETRLGS